MSVPSMVHRSGNSLIVRSVVSGDALFGSADAVTAAEDDVNYTSVGESNSVDDAGKELPDCKVKRNYPCGRCSFFTQNPRLYLTHLRDDHNEKVKIYECPSCLYASKHYQKLLRHQKMVHGNASETSVEPAGDGSRQSRKRPASTAADDEETVAADAAPDDHDDEEYERAAAFKCSMCAFTSKVQSQLSRHEREEHIKTKFFRCNKCNYVTHIKARYTKHVKYHSMPMIKCGMCDFRTPYKWNLDRHCKNHNGRGPFKCSACNFTADIKQSLTVHEMNHHVPPVGQAVGLGVGRRRNKVGASDATAAEEAAQQLQSANVANQVGKKETRTGATDGDTKKTQKSNKKSKLGGNVDAKKFGSDFLHPDDIVTHTNGNVYIKSKCRLCNYKTAWDGEMIKHEKRVHGIDHDDHGKPVKKVPRPIPNLIPLPQQNAFNKQVLRHSQPPLQVAEIPELKEPEISERVINDICAKSGNSSLKDFASLFSSEEMFKEQKVTSQVPDLIPTSVYSSTPKKINDSAKKDLSYFHDLLSTSDSNLVCNACGHESSCLTEHVKHQKSCGKELKKIPNIVPVHNISSTRCQFCRQRCKSSTDLYNHLFSCTEYIKSLTTPADDIDDTSEPGELHIDEDVGENKVFVWNNIETPMNIKANDSKYVYVDDTIENASIRYRTDTLSPENDSSEHSYQISQDFLPVSNSSSVHHSPVATEKIPTHGTDISIAQHKRVFKCPHCTFWASTASRFHVHIVGHLNKKPFECSLCAYRSNWRWDITKHIKLKSVRDRAHESAKVLMTDETGRRNYTKYNKYLTEIPVSGDQTQETSGGSGTRPRNHDRNSSPSTSKDLAKLSRAGTVVDVQKPLRPPPPLKPTSGQKKGNVEGRRTMFKCKRCNFRDSSRDVLLDHVKGHYMAMAQSNVVTLSSDLPDHSVRGTSPDDERHCRLKHSGDIRVVSNKNGQEKIEVEEQTDEPDHVDVPQTGAFKCVTCPYSTEEESELNEHLSGHNQRTNNPYKCQYCKYGVTERDDLLEHLRLHGICDPEDFLYKTTERCTNEGGLVKRYKCTLCPYVTNSKSQYTYHKQFHKPRGGQYTCTQCNYNVSKRHLLHQHLKVHGINITPHRQNGESMDLDDISDEIEEVPSYAHNFDTQNLSDIPLVWVSKNQKFSKMFKCRYCPHVNLRKVNIQEHEKMHGIREKNANTSRLNDTEHKCTECNYICNNAGVLSSHSKVHQGLYGVIHRIVDFTKSDEEQLRELKKSLGYADSNSYDAMEMIETDVEEVPNNTLTTLFFCQECPARFLKENEFAIHKQFHGSKGLFKCEYCTYSTEQGDYITQHQQIHHKQYQDRTLVLQQLHRTSVEYPQPQTFVNKNANDELIWIVIKAEKPEPSLDTLSRLLNKPPRSSQNVPLSGTELFQQKNEEEQKQAAALAQLIKEEPASPSTDSELMMQGNPDIIYPTSMKNGKIKEKRYKCPKCPSAFDKREQFKVHMSLHGSNQRYSCEHCDYAVNYYANYSQHTKKHAAQADAQAAARLADEDEEIEEVAGEPMDVDQDGQQQPLELCVPDNKAIKQQRQSSQNPGEDATECVMNTCTLCPYASNQPDAFENHRNKHVSVSGIKSTYTCEHCDFSVPQTHNLREHEKVHFMPNKINQVDGFMICDNMKLTTARAEGKSPERSVIFEEQGSKSTDKQFLPPLSGDVAERFNNNEGEKQLVNMQTGELVNRKNISDTRSSTNQEEVRDMEVISQTSSDN
ncbi:uncharacterized protein LOC109601872 isoform X2 [Aethina tumida]|uniref:uncharacterized protein LOC109601872 isoform X2 n=1 Tax=Aethina tumida TaxID=116153 RepID=UPI00096B6560|nr:uncharacterized protein LOC109601872 isoform X2 [Aethina tumida]